MQMLSVGEEDHSSEEDFTENTSGLEAEEKGNWMKTERSSALVGPKTRQFQIFGRELTSLEIPKRGNMLEGPENEQGGAGQSSTSFQMDSPAGDQETEQAYESELDHTITKQNFSDDDSHVGTILKKTIRKRRIASHKEMKSYQLGKQLSCKWTTGAGPRIGCVRDYPCKLQFRALEQVNLSPRIGCHYTSSFAPRVPNPVTKISLESLPRGLEHNTP